jgi:hypothetical protein
VVEQLFFTLGIVNNLALLLVFVVRARRLDLVSRFGWVYLLLVVPAAWAIVLAVQQGAPVQYPVFLSIYLAFLAVEGLYDWVLRLPFREHSDWRLLGPYVALYVSSCHVFVVMAWRESTAAGLVMLALTTARLLANAMTHPTA